MKCKDCKYADKEDLKSYTAKQEAVKKFLKEADFSKLLLNVPPVAEVRCYRYPKIEKIVPDNWCGEFKERVKE